MAVRTTIGGRNAGKVYSYSLALNIEENMNLDVNVTDWKEGASTDISLPRK